MNKQGSSSKNHHPSPQNLSSTTSSSPVIIPTPPSTEEVEPDDNILMDTGKSSKTSVAVEAANNLQPKQETPSLVQEAGEKDAKSGPADKKQKTKPEKKGSRATKANKQKEESSASESSSDDSLSDSENSDSSEDERAIRKKKKKLAAKKAAEKKKAKQKEREKAKKKKKSRKYESSDDSSSESDSDSDSDSEDEKTTRKKKAAKAKRKKKTKSKRYESSSEESSSSFSSSSESDSEDEKKRKKKNAKQRRSKVNAKTKSSKKAKAEETSSSSGSESDTESTPATSDSSATLTASNNSHPNQQAKVKLPAPPVLRKTKVDITKTDDKPQQKKKNVLEFKRVDQVWDSKIRDYKYTESVEEQKDEFDSVFTVRRRFGWDNKYIETQVDIKSKLLRNVLQTILKDCKSISLVEDKPSIQPHMLFHYYEEIKSYVKKTLKPKLKKAKKRKDRKQLEQQIAQSKLLLRYIDEDYEETRNALEPMLNAGTITYNLVWALFKPNTIAYTPTYGNKDDPRCFKVDHCYEEEDWFGNKKWSIEGRYLEYDGKVFGLGDHFVQIGAFKGPRKISNLAAYPLDFHKDPENLREQLIERGKKFVSLQGMNYRFHKGLGYMKVKRSIAKININGRVMIDPAIFRRINPNYPLSYIKQDELGQDESGSEDSSDEGCSDEDGDSEDEKPKGRMFMWKDKQGKKHVIHIPVSDKGPDITAQKLDNVEEESDEAGHVFTEEELLIASPVVLGFTFSEKLWLEFSLSGINEIEWNDEAFDNLVISKQTKQNLKGLVSSHRFNAAKTIDDVIVGKGKGLNVVLHGPPGVGKTLTGESIAEYLRCPLYAVSSGELGTNAAQLERDLNRIMDITHSWGAILLLDEADVFLEARQPHDIHRNALVSVFLRLTEYYQGILFLTTNRVSTFDEAFQSRIHMGIRYENLTAKARKKIWQHHVGKVLQMADKDEAGMCKPFAESDYDELSKKVMNGRQIKNAVKTSQAIAISEKGIFGMEYVRRVMEAHETFEEDMKGGRGYRDAMRQYT